MKQVDYEALCAASETYTDLLKSTEKFSEHDADANFAVVSEVAVMLRLFASFMCPEVLREWTELAINEAEQAAQRHQH
jgi:hypothetical protein